MSRTFLFSLPFAIAHVLSAAEVTEITIAPQPFTIRHEITASALPAEFQTIKIDAAAWPEFEITNITPHGTRVSKGDVLIAFDAENIDEKIHDTRRAIESRAQDIARTEVDLAHLKQTTPHRLDAVRRAAAEAAEENAYFTATRRKAQEDAADQKLKNTVSYLENQREELRQLEKMYSADELTEETEEIILQRQRDRVEAAEFDLAMEKLEHKRLREVMLPREAKKLADAERDTAIALKKFEQDAPRAIAKAEFDLESLRIAQTREETLLAKLESDRKQFEIKAPADGWFYHGNMENGRWSTGEIVKTLVPQGKPPVLKPLAIFIAKDAPLEATAYVDDSVAQCAKNDSSAIAWLEGREESGFAVKLKQVAAAPDTEGRRHAVFSAEWPGDIEIAPAWKVGIRLISYHSPAAIVLPAEALRFDPEGWTVAVKLADGKTERRAVKRGRVSGGKCEILSGLEAGQVVVLP